MQEDQGEKYQRALGKAASEEITKLVHTKRQQPCWVLLTSKEQGTNQKVSAYIAAWT